MLADITEVIDCSDMIISPGFIDTHRPYGRHISRAGTAITLSVTMYAWMLGGFFYDVKDVHVGRHGGAWRVSMLGQRWS